MPRRGESIRKRKDGRWEGRYYRFDTSAEKYKLHSVYARSYAEVKEKLIREKENAIRLKFTQNIMAGITSEEIASGSTDTDITFQKAADEWLKKLEADSKHSTFIKYRNIYRKYLKRRFGSYQMQSLSENIILNEMSELSDSGVTLSDSLYKSIYCVLNQIIRYGTKYYHTPAIKLSYKKRQNSNKPVEILNHTEQSNLVKILFNDMDIDKLGIIICLSTGLRLGEICALRWNDIDMNEKVLHVNRTVQRIETDNQNTKTVLWESEPKSIFSKREIPISDSLVILLTSFSSTGEYVLNRNKPMEPRTYQNHFKKYLKKAGIGKKNFHVLRHTFATNCIDNGADIKSISEILGHSDVNITLNRYVHPTIETKRQYMNSLFSIYGQYMGQ